MNESMIDRISRLLKEQHKQAKDMCEYVGISPNTFSTWKKRNTEPNAKHITPLSKFFGVSERYLLTGEDQDEKGYYFDPEVAELAQEMATRPELKVLFSASRNVSKESIEAINNMIKQMKKD